jgi:hypothetical protein
MSNIIFMVLLGGLSAAGLWLGYSWEPVATAAGGAVSLYALLRQEISERILRVIAKDIRARRGGLSGLVRRVCRPRLPRLGKPRQDASSS